MRIIRYGCAAMILLVGLGVMGPFGVVNAVSVRDNEKDYLWHPKAPVAWNSTFIPFEMRGKPWAEVFSWFADQTGMKVVGPYPAPPGTFTFVNPGGTKHPKMYSLVDVYDMINEVLQGSTKHTLIRGDRTLTVLPADAAIGDWPPFPRVRLEDLPGRGRTEMVVVEVKIDPDTLLQVTHCLGEHARVTRLENGRCRLRTSVGSLVLLMQVISLEEEN